VRRKVIMSSAWTVQFSFDDIGGGNSSPQPAFRVARALLGFIVGYVAGVSNRAVQRY
jgi:hypothetical protein